MGSRRAWNKGTHQQWVEILNNVPNEKFEAIDTYIDNKTQVRIKHVDCGYEFKVSPEYFKTHKYCRECHRKNKPKRKPYSFKKSRVKIGVNDLYTTHPHICEYMLDKNNGYRFSFGCESKIDWVCSNCGEIIRNKRICDVVKKGYLNCSICSDNFSLANKIMYSVLNQLKIEFTSEYRPNWCVFKFKDRNRYGQYDFYFQIDDKKYLVEMDGDWHKKYNHLSGQTVEEAHFIDKQKDTLARQNGFDIIRIDCFGCTYDIIKNAIIDSKLTKILEIASVNWEIIFLNTIRPIVFDICSDYNNRDLSSGDLGKIYNLAQPTIIKYLKQGRRIGICDYDPKIETLKRVSKPVICTTNNRRYDSIKMAAIDIMNKNIKYLDKVQTRISQVCSGVRHYCGKDKITGEKLIWRYLDANNRIIDVDYKRKNRSRKKATKVVCLNTRTVFSSIKEAQELYNIKTLPMSEIISGKKKSRGKHPVTNEKLKWDYYDEEKYGDFEYYVSEFV